MHAASLLLSAFSMNSSSSTVCEALTLLDQPTGRSVSTTLDERQQGCWCRFHRNDSQNIASLACNLPVLDLQLDRELLQSHWAASQRTL